MAHNLNLILIQLDSLNRHFLTCYGNSWIKTANLTAFAERLSSTIILPAHWPVCRPGAKFGPAHRDFSGVLRNHMEALGVPAEQFQRLGV